MKNFWVVYLLFVALSTLPSKNQLLGNPSFGANSAQTVELEYHRRRTDPDSILNAAEQLLHVAPAFSKPYAFAAFSAAESHLELFQEAAYLQFRSLLKPSEYAPSLRPLIDFYLLILDAKYDYKFSLNTERLTIRLLNAISLAETFHPEMVPSLIVILCETYSHLGLFQQIIDQVEYFKSTIKPRIKDELDALKYDHYLGRILFFIKRYSRASNMQEQVINRLQQYPERLTALLAKCHYYAAEACYYQHRDESCLPAFEQAITLKPNKDYVEMYVAILYHSQKYDRAIEVCQRFFSETIQGFQPTSPLDNPDISGEVMGGQYPGNLLMWKGRALYKKSIDLADAQAIPMLACGLVAAERGRILHNRIMFAADGYKMSQLILNNQLTYGLGYQMRIAYQLWSRTQQHQYKKLFFHYMEMRKNYLLSAAFSGNHLPPAEKQRLAKHSKKLESLEYALMRAPKDSSAWYHNQLIQQSEALDQCVQEQKEQYPRQITDHAQLLYAAPDDLQRKLDDSTAILICAQHWKHHYVYLITASDQQLLKIYHGSEISHWLESLNKVAASSLQMQKSKHEKFIRVAHQLYNTYLLPFEEALADKKRLVIIPEEYSGQIPFELLLDSEEIKPYEELNFLIKRFETSYHYSATFYDRTPPQSIQNGSFLGFAPVFESGAKVNSPIRRSRRFRSRAAGIQKGGFTPLPGTAREVTEIANLIASDKHKTILLRSDATNIRLAQELNKPYQYIHLATHGLPDLIDPRLSAFACYDTEGKRGSFLFAHHIESLSLDADLAVLSSCETGVGMILEGENIIALSRSFLAAGVPNIVYSLWKVDDNISSELMIDFYSRHLKGDAYAKALRAAKLSLINNPATAAPRFWAPFVLVGH